MSDGSDLLTDTAASAVAAQRQKVRRAMRDMAMNALARREHGEYELANKLQGKYGDQALVHQVIGALIEEGLLSDQRFAEMVCRVRYRKGYGPSRVRHELAQHRVADALISEVMGDYEDLWLGQLQAVKDKKFGSAPAKDYKEWAKQARFLQSRGFTTAHIQTVLERA